MGCQRDSAQHADRIFAETYPGVADGFDGAPLQIAKAADEVDDAVFGDVVEEPVHREVSAEGVFGGRAERVVLMNQELLRVGRLERRTEGRDFEDLVRERHMDEAESAADDATVAEQALHLTRRRRRHDVEVLRTSAEQQIADAASAEVGRESRPRDAVDDPGGFGAQRQRAVRHGGVDDPAIDGTREIPAGGGGPGDHLGPSEWSAPSAFLRRCARRRGRARGGLRIGLNQAGSSEGTHRGRQSSSLLGFRRRRRFRWPT